MNKLFWISLIIVLTAFTGYDAVSEASDIAKTENKTIADIPQSAWDRLAEKKIYFGHHSVGKNIIEGLNEILEQHPNIKLNIIKAKTAGQTLQQPGFYEGGVGRNFHPMTKIESFREKIDNGYGASADIAFFKFCFVDFNPNTDIETLFKAYSTTLDELSKKYPQTTFAAVTAPLSCYAPGLRGVKKRIKTFIKTIIGKVNTYDFSSANRFNELLLQKYTGKIPVFDLARVESTKPDGTRVIKEKNGTKNYELVPMYTTDGGHLNKRGKQVVAEQFLLFLVELAQADQ
jgi:hypothetical protein